MISPAMSSDTSRDQPSAALKAITRSGIVVLAGEEVPDDGRTIGLGEVSLKIRPPRRAEVLEYDVDGRCRCSGTEGHDTQLSQAPHRSIVATPKWDCESVVSAHAAI